MHKEHLPDEDYHRPNADKMSIPSSVDPDADPLGECGQCGTRSRRAWTKGLCPKCAETDVTTADCGFDCDNLAYTRLPDGKPVCRSCGREVIEAIVS